MQRLHNVSLAQTAANTRDSSPDASTVKTLVPQPGVAANACLISVETTSARVTFDGSTPSATNGLVLIAAQNPLYLPFAATIKWTSTAGTASVLDVTWLSA